ncbi:MAG: HNH endonuclease, partial [Solirubrobacteraceae bacterium]
ALMRDEDVTSRKGIYAYVLTGDERSLSIRRFSDNDKRAAFERQSGLCANKTRCLTPGNSDGKKVFDIAEMEADHITPWSKGGRTDAANCQMLCLPCNRRKGGK